MMVLQQSPTQTDLRGFDLNMLFRTFSDISGWVLARVPYLVIGAIVLMIVLALPVVWDREKEARSAGLRTFPLVAVASCG